MAALRPVSLSDKYLQQDGVVYLSGMQALVRLPLLQRERDRIAGLDTAGLVTGYRGSPIGGYDRELARVESLLAEHQLRFQPGLNEDLAATACWGAQQIELFPGARHAGVFCIWYGKGPGLDRSTDAIKHASHYGTSRLGGVLAVVGDDHLAKSSAFGHQSEYGFVDCLMPTLAPANITEILEFGLLGFALSRYCGAWVGFKLAGSICEGSAAVRLPDVSSRPPVPADFGLPADGVHIRWPDDPAAIERRARHVKLPAAQAFIRAAGADRVSGAREGARLGIIAPGRAWQQLQQALAELSLSEADLPRLGVRLYKPAMVWPLEPQGLLRFAAGLETILVVEDKRPLVEDQVKVLLYGNPAGGVPRVIGKRDEAGAPLLPETGEIDALAVALALQARLGLPDENARALRERLARATPAPGLVRTPYFCAGCPHNTSTRIPDDSVVIGGIGCHTLAMGMDRGMRTFSHMGGEGATWIGLAPFTDLPHVFQNMGDGTYQHSGSMGIRAAVAAGVNVTFKILYNDAVAMTGGQPVEGQPTVPQIARQLAAEGVGAIAVVTDEPGKYGGRAGFPPGVSIHHRRELDAVQRRLQETPGVTALVYDQTCAAEKRRRRKRGTMPDPGRRVFINELVCEGCGDCGKQSNCVAVVPSETEYGIKRQIDQSACNMDYSCLNGFCPSFVTVEGGRLRQRAVLEAGPLPPPASSQPLDSQAWSLLLAGIGGTGIVTVGAILGVAAHSEGRAVTVNDVTGMAQKGGPVLGHVRIAATPERLGSERIPPGGADLLIAADLVVAAMPDALSRTGPQTRAIANTDATPTGAFTQNPDERIDSAALVARLQERLGEVGTLPALRAAQAATGDPVGASLLLLGHAWQRGLVPLGAESIESAIGLNGVAVERNLAAFRWGRRLAADPLALQSLGVHDASPASLEATIAHRRDFLAGYQDRRYAARYVDLVGQVRSRETSVVPGSQRLTEAVAHAAFKLMAYKDEYEVARLHALPRFRSRLDEVFEGNYRLRVHLAPPLLARTDPATGRPRKIAFGGWLFRLFPLLAGLRFLRGTPFDPFGWTAERRLERRLVEEYFGLVRRLCDGLDAGRLPIAIELAEQPLAFRGFGFVKAQAIDETRQRQRALEQRWQASS
jgi:indolepyruvate ferredoxin oxidoreductase